LKIPSSKRTVNAFVPATKGGTKRGIRIIGSKNSFAFDENVRKESRVPRIEKPKEKRTRIRKKGIKGGKFIFKKTENIIIRINPDIV